MALSKDLKHLQENGSASAAEMAEFLAHLRGRRPQEVLGIVAQSGLTRGITIATIWTLVFMAIFTAGPYFWSNKSQAKPVAKEAAPAVKPAEAAPAEPAPAAATVPAAAAAKPATPDVPSKDVMDKLGIGEAKPADPKSNPLENKVDDLLKDLK